MLTIAVGNTKMQIIDSEFALFEALVNGIDIIIYQLFGYPNLIYFSDKFGKEKAQKLMVSALGAEAFKAVEEETTEKLSCFSTAKGATVSAVTLRNILNTP